MMEFVGRRREPILRIVLRRASVRAELPARALVGWDRWIRTGAEQTWDSVVMQLLTVAPTMIGVDVFDTVLSRRVVGDGATSWVTGTQLAAEGSWPYSIDGFVEARRDAARSRPIGALSEIYGSQPLARCATQAGVRVECDVERQLAVPVEGARTALQRLRDAGHQIVFVSDMHLPRQHLWACLTDLHLAVSTDVLVVSSEVGASKSDGTLFGFLRDQGISLGWHVGNDLWSDVAMAERAGVRALPIKVAEPTALETVMAGPPGSVGAAIAGAARRARWINHPADIIEVALRETGADVAGQCLTAFLLWVRDVCASAGIERLAFLARDGELPLRMARAMPVDHWEGIELRYLQGSRRLWSVAAAAVHGVAEWLHAGTTDDTAFIRQGQHKIPWSSLLARVALTPSDLSGHPALRALDPDRPLPAAHDCAWRSLLADEEIHNRIASRAAEQLMNLRQHLLAEGIGDGRFGLVDVGWRGQLAWHISSVVGSITGNEPMHLHFGTVDTAPEASQVDIRRFAIDDAVAPPPFADIISCVETFTASGRPRATALERDREGEVHLIFDDAVPQMDTAERRMLWEGALDVARNLPPRAELRAWGLVNDYLPERVRHVLTSFWLTPSATHARAAANLSAEIDDAGVGIEIIASPYRLRRGGGGSRTWRQGSLRLTPRALRHPLGLLFSVQTLFGRTRRGRSRRSVPARLLKASCGSSEAEARVGG